MTESESIEVLELRGRVQTLEGKLESIETSGGVGIPQTSLLSPNFLARAFTVWGHYFVANLLIGLAIALPFICLAMLGILLGLIPDMSAMNW